MAMTLEEELAALATMSPAQLRIKWQRVYREPPPPFAPDLLARGIAYRLQEKVYGKLLATTRREIERLQRQYEKNGEVVTEACATTKPGTVLIREGGSDRVGRRSPNSSAIGSASLRCRLPLVFRC